MWSARADGMGRPSRTKSHPAGSLSSCQQSGPPCWASPLTFGLIGRARISVPAFLLPHWSIFSKVHAIAGFRNNFQNQRLCRISKRFHRSKQKLYFEFSPQKNSQILWKPLALIQEVLILFFGPSKNLISWHYPVKSNIIKTRTNENQTLLETIWEFATPRYSYIYQLPAIKSTERILKYFLITTQVSEFECS